VWPSGQEAIYWNFQKKNPEELFEGRSNGGPKHVSVLNMCIVLDHQESSRRVEIVLQQSQLALLVRSRLDDSRLRSRSWCLLRRASGLP
jgi:hypothetical protein